MKNAFGKFADIISSIFVPVIPCLCGAGMLKVILILGTTFGLISAKSQTYVLVNMVSDAVFYYLPVFLAFSSALVFKCNTFFAAVMGAILIHPTFLALVKTGTPVKMFGIPVTLINYASSVIPIIFIIYFMSWVEKIAKKGIPQSIKFITVPLVTFLVTSLVAFTLLGPIGTWCGNVLVLVFTKLDQLVPWLCPVLIGTFLPFIVMTGMHNGFKSITYSQYALLGYATVVGPGSLASNISQGVASFIVGLKTKKTTLKQTAFSAAVSAIIGGITEPALYGITLKYKSVLKSVMLGGGVAGLWAGISRMRTYTPGAASLFGIPCYIGGGSLKNMYNAIICIIISSVVTTISMMIFGLKDIDKDIEQNESVLPDKFLSL